MAIAEWSSWQSEHDSWNTAKDNIKTQVATQADTAVIDEAAGVAALAALSTLVDELQLFVDTLKKERDANEVHVHNHL